MYTASNSSGLTEEKVLWVYAKTAANPIKIRLSDDKIIECKAGEFVPYAEAVAEGGNGKLQLAVYAKNGETKLQSENGFRPEKTGTWQVVYTAVDYVGNVAMVGYDVTVTANEAPVLVEDINLPQAFVSEASFVLPRVYANKYDENGVNKVPCTCE